MIYVIETERKEEEEERRLRWIYIGLSEVGVERNDK